MSGTAAMELAEGQLYNKSKWIKPLMPLEKRRFVCPAACEAKQFVRCTCKKGLNLKKQNGRRFCDFSSSSGQCHLAVLNNRSNGPAER